MMLTMFRDAHTDARTHARTNRTKTVCLRPHYVWRRHKKKKNRFNTVFRHLLSTVRITKLTDMLQQISVITTVYKFMINYFNSGFSSIVEVLKRCIYYHNIQLDWQVLAVYACTQCKSVLFCTSRLNFS